MTVFCIMMAISAVSAAEEVTDKPIEGVGGENDMESMMNRTIEMIDKTTESFESMKADANDTTIKDINGYLDELESIRSNVENAESAEDLNTERTSLDELFKAMNEELGSELPMNDNRPEMSGMGNQTGPGSSQMSGMENQSNGQPPMKGNDSVIMEGSHEKIKEMQNSPDDSGIFDKIMNFFGSLFN